MGYPKVFKCQHCGYNVRFDSSIKGPENAKYKMGEHYETNHKELLPPDMDGFQYFYWLLTKLDRGICMQCNGHTEFNRLTMRYGRLCDKVSCREAYKAERNNRMIGKYGKVSLLKDPDQQRKMQEGRKLSGKYIWSDGKSEMFYLGSYEKDFLEYLDKTLHWPLCDIMPSPHVYLFHHNGMACNYIPDYFIPSLSLEIEIKDDGSNKVINPDSRARDITKAELLKSLSNHFNFIKIVNKDYSEFETFIREEA